MKRTTERGKRRGWRWGPALGAAGIFGVALLVARLGGVHAGTPGSEILFRSVADLRSLQSVFADPVAHEALRSLCATHSLWSIETSAEVVDEIRGCDGGPAGPGAFPERVRHAFTFLRELEVSSRAFELVYTTCSVSAENHHVERAAQAFRTRRDAPPESIAADDRRFLVFCAGIRDPEVTAALAEALRHRSIAASRVRFVERDGSVEVYALSFFVRDPFDGQEQIAVEFLARYTPADGHLFFSRD